MGGFSKVYKGMHRVSKERVAIKVFDKPSMKESNINDARREAEIMKQLRH